jgi:predicted nucleic acid-binding protein
MTFVDTNVFMYAVGLSHPLKSPSREFFEASLEDQAILVTSAEVLQELLHVYLPANRLETLDAAMILVDSCIQKVFPIEREDVEFARSLITRYPNLSARDLIHLACCRRHEIKKVKTFDRQLAAQFRTK